MSRLILHTEMSADAELIRLGQEKAGVPDTDFRSKAYKTCARSTGFRVAWDPLAREHHKLVALIGAIYHQKPTTLVGFGQGLAAADRSGRVSAPDHMERLAGV